MSLVPLKCASNPEVPSKDLIVILDDEKTGLCIERNLFLTSVFKEQPVNGIVYGRDAYVLVQNYPQYTLFQRILNSHLRIIKGTIDDYINSLISSDEIKANNTDATLEHELGKGGFGTVYAYGDNPIVVKVSTNFRVFERNPAELAVLRVIKNAECCLADALDVTVTEDTVNIYMKRMKGDLYSLLYEDSIAIDVKKMFYQLCVGLYFLQSKGIMNRDIKSENCLYDSDMKAYIADWGIGVYWPYMGAKLEYNVATPSYRPPEVYQNAKYDMSFDIFSLGLVGLDLHLRKAHNSLEGENPQGLEVKNVKDEKNYKLMIRNLYGINVTADLPKLKAPIKALINAPEPLKQLLQWMICNDPKVRPTISQVLHHPYFDSERGTRTFPEISYIEMLRNSPPMNMVTEVDNKSSTDPMEKLQLISNSNYVISVFLALAFYNRYKAKNGVLKGVDLTDTCLYLARSLIEGGTWEKDKTIKNSVKVAKLLNYELMGCIPYLFFRNPTKRVIRELLMYELAATQPYHPYTVASIIAHTDAKDGSIFLKSSYPIINHPSVSDFYGHLNQTYRALSSDKKDEFNEIVDDLYTLISNDEYFLFLLQSPDKARAFRDSL